MPFCPYSYFVIAQNKSCKQCLSTNCSLEIKRTPFTITQISENNFNAKLSKEIFLKQLNITQLTYSKLFQTTTSSGDANYCDVSIESLSNNVDYQLTNTSTLDKNILNCNMNFDFYKSFKNKSMNVDLNSSLFSGQKVIIDSENNPVYVDQGSFLIPQFRKNDDTIKFNVEVFCVLVLVFFWVFVVISVIYILLKNDNFLKWLMLYAINCVHIFAFMISMNTEFPMNLRYFLLCLYKNFIRWFGGIR